MSQHTTKNSWSAGNAPEKTDQTSKPLPVDDSKNDKQIRDDKHCCCDTFRKMFNPLRSVDEALQLEIRFCCTPWPHEDRHGWLALANFRLLSPSYNPARWYMYGPGVKFVRSETAEPNSGPEPSRLAEIERKISHMLQTVVSRAVAICNEKKIPIKTIPAMLENKVAEAEAPELIELRSQFRHTPLFWSSDSDFQCARHASFSKEEEKQVPVPPAPSSTFIPHYYWRADSLTACYCEIKSHTFNVDGENVTMFCRFCHVIDEDENVVCLYQVTVIPPGEEGPGWFMAGSTKKPIENDAAKRKAWQRGRFEYYQSVVKLALDWIAADKLPINTINQVLQGHERGKRLVPLLDVWPIEFVKIGPEHKLVLPPASIPSYLGIENVCKSWIRNNRNDPVRTFIN
jgi:hypothetical protein